MAVESTDNTNYGGKAVTSGPLKNFHLTDRGKATMYTSITKGTHGCETPEIRHSTMLTSLMLFISVDVACLATIYWPFVE